MTSEKNYIGSKFEFDDEEIIQENKLTYHDLLVLSAYTQILFVKDFNDVHKLIEDEVMKEPMLTHELVYPHVKDAINKTLKCEFMKVCEKLYKIAIKESEVQNENNPTTK